jgi:hypothetical protein
LKHSARTNFTYLDLPALSGVPPLVALPAALTYPPPSLFSPTSSPSCLAPCTALPALSLLPYKPIGPPLSPLPTYLTQPACLLLPCLTCPTCYLHCTVSLLACLALPTPSCLSSPAYLSARPTYLPPSLPLPILTPLLCPVQHSYLLHPSRLPADITLLDSLSCFAT